MNESIPVKVMHKIKALVRTFLFFLFGIGLRASRSSPIFKRFARAILRYFPKLARFYARLMSRSATLPSQSMATRHQPPAQKMRNLSPRAAVIFSDLKTAISQLKSNADEAPQSKKG